MSNTPLHGLKVVELARILAGPWAGQTLSDLGATVIKIESSEGDDTRQWGPPWVDTDGDQAAAYFHACNRGKQSVVADLKTEEGIGPKIEGLLNAAGINTFAQLEKTDTAKIKGILTEAGNRYKAHEPTTWPRQAGMAAAGKWDELQKWQDELDGGKEVKASKEEE